MLTPPVVDLTSAAFLDNPHPTYARLQSESPVYFSDAWKSWLVLRYDDVMACYRDPRLSANRAGAFSALLPEPLRPVAEPIVRNLSSWALLVDPPSHTRLRALLNQAFTPRLVHSLVPRIEAVVDGLLAPLSANTDVDLVKALAEPLPVAVIGELLGVSRDAWPRLKTWSTHLVSFMGAARVTVELLQNAAQAVGELEAFFRSELEARQKTPQNDLLTNLLAAREQGSILSEQELLSTCCMALFGGHETTTNLIGNALFHLLQQPPDVLPTLRDPSKMSTAIEEIMRFESPVQRMGRIVTEDLTLRGQLIPKGQRLFLMLGAANRDPLQFASADRLILDRKDNRHVGFGFGAHYCVGAALGRQETSISLLRLLARFPSLRLLSAAPAWHPNATVRGPSSLFAHIS